MLSIRMQRLGRKGHPTYRVVVQDSRQAPTSGKYVALLGSYDPHTKTSSLQKERAQFYLDHGAQPSDRVVSLFKSEKVKLPKWVKDPTKQKRDIRNPEKLRKNRPAEEAAPAEPAEETPAPAEEPAAAEPGSEETEKPEAAGEEKPEEVAEADEKSEDSEAKESKKEA